MTWFTYERMRTALRASAEANIDGLSYKDFLELEPEEAYEMAKNPIEELGLDYDELQKLADDFSKRLRKTKTGQFLLESPVDIVAASSVCWGIRTGVQLERARKLEESVNQ